jgi:hypothetical protein
MNDETKDSEASIALQFGELIAIIVLGLVLRITVKALLVMFFWNMVGPEVFHTERVSYLHSIYLTLLIETALFGSVYSQPPVSSERVVSSSKDRSQ